MFFTALFSLIKRCSEILCGIYLRLFSRLLKRYFSAYLTGFLCLSRSLAFSIIIGAVKVSWQLFRTIFSLFQTLREILRLLGTLSLLVVIFMPTYETFSLLITFPKFFRGIYLKSSSHPFYNLSGLLLPYCRLLCIVVSIQNANKYEVRNYIRSETVM